MGQSQGVGSGNEPKPEIDPFLSSGQSESSRHHPPHLHDSAGGGNALFAGSVLMMRCCGTIARDERLRRI